MGLEALSPEYRTQYEALLPELIKGRRAAANARGMFYSGQAIDEEGEAEAALLARLASESAATTSREREGQRNRDLEEKIKREDIKAKERMSTRGDIAGGVGSLATLAMLARGAKNTPMNIFQDRAGNWMKLNPAGQMVPLETAPAAGGAAGPRFAPDTITANNMFVPGAAIPTPVPPAPSMWQNAKSAGLSGLAAAGLGGYAGANFGNLVAGRSSEEGNIGAAAGGAAVPLAMLAAGYSNPWALGLGALGGAAGGNLLGNLFRSWR